MKKQVLRYVAFAAMAWSCSFAVQAADWPSKPLRVIVPSAAGGSPDIVIRLLGNALAKRLGQSVLVDNRPGAAGNIGMQALMNAVPDGYTLAYANNATLATNQFLFSSLPYDPAKLVPVIGLVSTHSLLVVSPRLPVQNVQELVAHAKQHPGTMTFASGGNGTSGHLGAEMFKVLTGVQALHVPYKGAPQAINDLVAGNVDFLIDNIASVGPMVQGNRLRALAVTSANRLPTYPDLPTVAESGLPQFEVRAWGGLVMPPGAPAEAVQRVNQEMNAVLADPQVREQLAKIAFVPLAGTPQAFTQLVQKERGTWQDIVRKSGAKID